MYKLNEIFLLYILLKYARTVPHLSASVLIDFFHFLQSFVKICKFNLKLVLKKKNAKFYYHISGKYEEAIREINLHQSYKSLKIIHRK